ncbi:MAG: pantoate--beta-alanine ligase [Phycisphaerae bacterium]|nr:pantoate--beta-alanine ligase [Phycisphaerae bacterium]
MFTATTIAEVREGLEPVRRADRCIGFVPTMGALHEGHVSLIRAARRDCAHVVVSIFVNPTQFGPGEDLAKYPRPLEEDLRACREAGTDLVFAPTASEMYRSNAVTTVRVGKLSEPLCGAFRPGHFEGVATVVAKLFNIVMPGRAYFGEKDYQQLVVIRQMVRDLDLPIGIVGCPTVRETGGLAMSSRNRYLSVEQRHQALSLNQALTEARQAVTAGTRDVSMLCDMIRRRILAAGEARMDYVSIVDAASLEALQTVDRPARMCVAVRIGDCRLIDNMPVDVPGAHG